jgi:hypothetical protein
VASNRLVIEGGCAEAPAAPGLGIVWRIDEIQSRALDPRRIDARA